MMMILLLIVKCTTTNEKIPGKARIQQRKAKGLYKTENPPFGNDAEDISSFQDALAGAYARQRRSLLRDMTASVAKVLPLVSDSTPEDEL